MYYLLVNLVNEITNKRDNMSHIMRLKYDYLLDISEFPHSISKMNQPPKEFKHFQTAYLFATSVIKKKKRRKN
jgi:hypothetical protein